MACHPHERGAACDGKVRHSTYSDGKAAIGNARRRRGKRERMNVYRCRFCSGFHVGRKRGHKSWR